MEGSKSRVGTLYQGFEPHVPTFGYVAMISASQQGQSHADSNMLDRTWQDCQEFQFMSIRSTG